MTVRGGSGMTAGGGHGHCKTGPNDKIQCPRTIAYAEIEERQSTAKAPAGLVNRSRFDSAVRGRPDLYGDRVDQPSVVGPSWQQTATYAFKTWTS